MHVVGGVMGQCGSRAVGSSSSYINIVVLCLVLFIIVSGEDRLPHESIIQCSRPENNTLLEDVGSPVFINYSLPMRLVKGQEIIYKKYDVGQPVSSWYNDSYAVHSSKNHTKIKVHDHNTVTIHMLHINCSDSDSYSLELYHKGTFQCQLLQVILNVKSTPPCERVTEEFVHEGTEQYFTIRNTSRNDQPLLPTSRRKPVESGPSSGSFRLNYTALFVTMTMLSRNNLSTPDTYATEQRHFLYSGIILFMVVFVVILTVLSYAGVRRFRIHCNKLGTKTMKRTFQTYPEKGTETENDRNIGIVDKGVGDSAIHEHVYDYAYVDQDESIINGKLQIYPTLSEPIYYIAVDGGSDYEAVGPNSLNTHVFSVYNPIDDVADDGVTYDGCAESNVHAMTNLNMWSCMNEAVSKVYRSGTSSSPPHHHSLEDTRGVRMPHSSRRSKPPHPYEGEGSIDKPQRRTVSAEYLGYFERDSVINGLDRARSTDKLSEMTSQPSPASSSSKPSASMDAICREQTFDCSMVSPYDNIHRDRLEIWRLH